MFLIFINISAYRTPLRVRLFADDCLPYRTITDVLFYFLFCCLFQTSMSIYKKVILYMIEQIPSLIYILKYMYIKRFKTRLHIYKLISPSNYSQLDSIAFKVILDRLCIWVNTWQMRFNEATCYILHIGTKRNKWKYTYSMNN